MSVLEKQPFPAAFRGTRSDDVLDFTHKPHGDGVYVGHWCSLLSDEDDDQQEGVMEDISEVIPRQFLNCGLCNEELQEPKLLPCLHSFCRRCLSSRMAPSNNNHAPGNNHHPHPGDQPPPSPQARHFTCPECGTQVSVADPGRLPDNVLARRLSLPSLSAPPPPAAHCAQCRQQERDDTPATIHCANCDENLCLSCASVHADQVETASHKVEPLTSALRRSKSQPDDGTSKRGDGDAEGTDSSPSDSLTAVLPKCCQCYDSYDIDSLYCVDCDLALCSDCHATHDERHRCAELSAIAQNFTSKIQAPIEELRRDSQTLGRMLGNLDRAERYAGKLQRDVQTRVRRRTRVLCGLIRDYESMLLQEIEQRHRQNTATIQQRRTSASQHASSISAVTELTDKLLQFGSEEEKVALRRKVGRRVRELCESELPSEPLELTNLRLHEPSVTVETICDLFGELRTDMVHPGVRRRVLTASHSVDSGSAAATIASSVSASLDDPCSELAELEEEEEEEENGGDNVLSNSDRTDTLNAERRRAEQKTREESRRRHHSDSRLPKDGTPPSSSRVAKRTSSLETSLTLGDRGGGGGGSGLDCGSSVGGGAGEERTDTSNSSFQSSGSAQDNIPTQLLETPRREIVLPDIIARDNIKGVGVNAHGDIIVATMATAGGTSKSAIYILEQHGIVRGQIPVAANWTVNCVTSDGKVALIVPRGDNRFKVKIMSDENGGSVLADVHLESLGLNFATATPTGQLLVASNRYAKLGFHGGKATRSGGNIAVYDSDGRLDKRLTNEELALKGPQLLERPNWIAMDAQNNVFVADPAAHCVVGFTWAGKLLFRLGNSDMEGDDLYQGPDSVCTDLHGHVVVTDKREGRIDVLNYQGQMLRSLFPSDPIKFVCTTPDKLLLVVPTEGSLKFYDYL